MNKFPAAYYKKDGVNSINLDGKRVNYSKTVAFNKKESDELAKDGWSGTLVECFKVKAKAKAAK